MRHQIDAHSRSFPIIVEIEEEPDKMKNGMKKAASDERRILNGLTK